MLTPLERKIALLRADVSMADVARDLGVTRAHVSLVVAGDRRRQRVEAAVAAALGLAVDDVFPPTEAADAAA